MKRIKRVLGILLVICFMMNVNVVHAEECLSEEMSDNSTADFSDGFLSYTNTCVAGKEQIYSFSVNFSEFSDVKIAAVRLGEGDVEIKVYDANENQVNRIYLHSMDSLGYMNSKVWDTLDKPQGASGDCVFTAKISTKTNSSFCFSVGNAKDLPYMLSGEDKITPMSEYRGFLQEGATNYQYINNYLPGESNADYYQYVATDHNIVLLTSSKDDLKFEIMNKDKKIIYTSTEEERTVDKKNFSSSRYYVRHDASKEMKAGETYYIKVYSVSGYKAAGNYRIQVGVPDVRFGESVSVLANKKATITNKQDTTFLFTVKGVSPSAKARQSVLSIGSSMYCGAYTLISPNSQMFKSKLAGNGVHSEDMTFPVDLTNFNSYKNPTMNGTWMLTLRSSGASYTTQPKLRLFYYYEIGTGDIL